MHERWVFTNWKRTNHRSGNTAYINEAIRKSGVDRSVHKLRHTFATKMLKEGLTLNDVRLLLGHASIQTTQRYQHLESNDVSPKAVAILNQQNVEWNRAKMKVMQPSFRQRCFRAYASRLQCGATSLPLNIPGDQE